MQKMRMKIIWVLIAVSTVLATLLTQETVAYYTALGEATNVVTAGDIGVQIIEKMGDRDFPKDGVYIMPGQVVSKKVSVANTGSHPFWLRVKLTNGIDREALDKDMFSLNLNLRDWIDGGDGYYYYNGIVQPGEVTPMLFSEVHIAGEMDTDYLGATLRLTVTAYAVQSEHNEADSPLHVQGWPAESGGDAS